MHQSELPFQDFDSSEENSKHGSTVLDGMQSDISKEVAGQLWQAGKQSTQRLISTYAHIDFLRPYFDIEPKEFRDRLLGAFIPRRPSYGPQEAPSELYGPLMITLSLVAVLLYGMKSSGHEIEEGTLIGTAMAICFCYWLGISSVVFFIAYLLNSQITIIQTLSLTGYAMCGHCIVLLFSTICDHNGLSYMFYFLWIIFGGLSGLKVVGVFMTRTWTLKDGIILSSLFVCIHLLFILYLRLQYHKVYEALSEAF